MTTLNIPSSPSQGATYEANGVIYTWDGTKWKADSSNVSNLNGGQLAGFRNQIINGDFRVWQRGTTGSLPAITGSYTSEYTADRMRVELRRPNGTAPLNWKQIEITDPNVPHNFGIELTIVGTDGDGYQTIGTNVENAKSLPAGQYTLSFWATGSSVIETRFGAFYGSANPDNENFATQLNTLTSTWTRYTVPVTITDQRSKTNTSNSNVGFQIILEGDSLPHTAGTFKFAGFQLEPGPVATPFEHRPIGTELALCQRYYYTTENETINSFMVNSDTLNRYAMIPYPVTMRVDPTVSVSWNGGTDGPTSANKFFAKPGRQTPDNTTVVSVTGFTADAEL